MRIFYQGQLDFFCGIYAVLNALQLVHGLTLGRARDLFAGLLTELPRHERVWQTTLRNETDFYWMVEYMLAAAQREFPLRVTRPFSREPLAATGLPEELDHARLRLPEAEREGGTDIAALWRALEAHLPEGPLEGNSGRAVVLRFHRFLAFSDLPVISHWSCGSRVLGDILALRDASKEEGALHSLTKGELALRRSEVGPARPVLLEPRSLFFLERL